MSNQTIDINDLSRPINRENLPIIMRTMLIGMAAYGELERLRDAYGTLKMLGKEVPDTLEPLDVSGNPEQISLFAEALLYLNVAKDHYLEKDGAAGG